MSPLCQLFIGRGTALTPHRSRRFSAPPGWQAASRWRAAGTVLLANIGEVAPATNSAVRAAYVDNEGSSRVVQTHAGSVSLPEAEALRPQSMRGTPSE